MGEDDDVRTADERAHHEASLRDYTCLGCGRESSFWYWLTWKRCGGCKALYCRDCSDRRTSRDGIRSWWRCSYCGNVDEGLNIPYYGQ